MAKLALPGDEPLFVPPPEKQAPPPIREQLAKLLTEREKSKLVKMMAKRQEQPSGNLLISVKAAQPSPPVPKPKRRLFRFTFKRFLALLAIGVLLFVGYFGFKTYKALSKIITHNTSGSAPALLGKLSPQDLAGEGDGRINILLLGVGGVGHAGEFLTDTIMLISIDPIDHKTAMLSIPRDLYVPIEGAGMNKINTAYAFGDAPLAKQTVSNLLDLPIHYYLRLDFEGFKKLIETIEGVDVDVPVDLYDNLYPDEADGYEVLQVSAGQQHMDGTLALKYARSRETTSDFDRAKRQQLILSAVRSKALSLEILSNPKKIAEMIDLLGDHLRTDLQPWEMEKLAEIAKDVDPSLVVNAVLDDSADNYLYGDSVSGVGYVLRPNAGDFSEIQKYAHSIFQDAFLSKEAATIVVQNGTERQGLGQRIADKLTGYNYNVTSVSDADKKDYQKTVIIDYTGGKKPYTLSFLQKRLSAEVKKESSQNPPADLLIIVGENAISAQ